jgi:hypothetical protein
MTSVGRFTDGSRLFGFSQAIAVERFISTADMLMTYTHKKKAPARYYWDPFDRVESTHTAVTPRCMDLSKDRTYLNLPNFFLENLQRGNAGGHQIYCT